MNLPEMEFAQQVFVIECGIANIKLGLFTKLARAYKNSFGSENAVPLAFCVVRDIFFDPTSQSKLDEFARRNNTMIEAEIHKALSDPELKEAISLVYAVRIMQLGWTRGSNDIGKLIERATDCDFLIPNIMEMYGSKAISTFFHYSIEFTARNLQG